MSEGRIQTPDILDADDDLEVTLRPRRLADFVGQSSLKDQLDVAIAQHLAVADIRDATIEPYGRGTRAWLIEDKHLPGAAAGRLLKVAQRLSIHPVMSDALAAGEISIEHAAPILRTLAKLAPADRAVDEKILVEAAKDIDPDALRTLCQATEEAACTNEEADARRVPLAQPAVPDLASGRRGRIARAVARSLRDAAARRRSGSGRRLQGDQ